ncbi:exodeoxyribonuclease VII large subunit [bacterium]|nr:exodeoxyribonuclease VII large subunit [bacterium]
MEEALKLSEFLEQIQEQVRSTFADTYSVVAEIASLSGSRHLYFELIEKEAGQICAKTRANLWAFNRFRVVGHFENVTRESLKAGMKVLFRVQPEFHLQYGFSLTIVDIDPSYSLGEFERIKQETIEQLKADGLLEMNKALPLPRVLHKLAIITSATAAGYGDFMKQLNHNTYGYTLHTVLFPCLVQGEKAPESIMAALDKVEMQANDFDAVVLIRGGGSVIDLSCFDDYQLNFTLAQTSYPVLTGIGHDRDESVADLVAHTGLKTPTAVAEFIINHNALFEGAIEALGRDIYYEANSYLDTETEKNNKLAVRLKTETQNLVHNQALILGSQKEKLRNRSDKALQQQETLLERELIQLNMQVKLQLQQAETLLLHAEQKCELLDPKRIFALGYSMSMVNGLPLGKAKVEVGQTLETTNGKQTLLSNITNIK